MKERIIKNKRPLDPTHISPKKRKRTGEWDNQKSRSNVSI
jgi:hypothetical protein